MDEWTLSTMTPRAQDGCVIWGTNVQASMEKFVLIDHISLVKKDTDQYPTGTGIT